MDDEDLKNLIPEIRCFALVGEFLQLWATMENALHDAIGTALEVEQTRLQILCENIEFSAKIYILRTLIDIAKAFPQRNKKSLQKELKALAEYSKLRNMIAHHQFEPHTDSKGVRFFVVKARGTFEIPQEIWAPSRF